MKIFVLAGLSVLTALGFTLAAQSSLKMEFVNVPAGEFVMGCSNGDSGCKPDESPRHRVQVTKGFEIGKYEVTQSAMDGNHANESEREQRREPSRRNCQQTGDSRFQSSMLAATATDSVCQPRKNGNAPDAPADPSDAVRVV